MSLTHESVIVITGAGSGIGRALARRLASENIRGIALADMNAEGVAETAALIQRPGLAVSVHKVDVSSESEMRSFADAVGTAHGGATHIINNAGVALGGNIRDVSIEEMRWLFEINFWGVVHGTKIFLPYLEKERSAHIVNISSIFGIIAPPGQGAYAASKFAVRGFTEALRHELRDTNIAVSVVHPGGVRTNIANSARIGAGTGLSPDEIERKKARINRKLDRTTPEQAAEKIVRGIVRRDPRIIVGGDALIMSVIARIFPRSYLTILNFMSRGQLDET